MKLPRTFFRYDESEEAKHPRFVIRKGYGGAMALQVSKFLQYVPLVPPDTSVSVSKFIQYVPLVPPDTSVSVSKFIQYAVLETVPATKHSRGPAAILFARNGEEDTRIWRRPQFAPADGGAPAAQVIGRPPPMLQRNVDDDVPPWRRRVFTAPGGGSASGNQSMFFFGT